MAFPFTREAIRVAKLHLKQTAVNRIEIEAVLVRHLLVVICAEYEETIEELACKKALVSGHQEFHNFVKSSLRNTFRSLKQGEIAGLLARFDGSLKSQFQALLQGTDAESSLNTIVTNRDKVSHTRETILMTLNDVRRDFIRSKRIIEEFANVMGVSM